MRNVKLVLALCSVVCVLLSLGVGLDTAHGVQSPARIHPASTGKPTSAPVETRIPVQGVRKPGLTLERLRPLLVPKPGAAYKRSSVVKHSRYLTPVKGEGLRGKSRRWGDADLSVQAECVNSLISDLRGAGYSKSEICFAVALWRCESGFNPDAAAGTSSACGLGQFLDRTRAVLCKRAGVNDSDPFSVDMNIACTRETLKECFAFARKYAPRDSTRYFEFAYAYHHDGPSADSGGREIARESVLPWLETAKRCISE